MKESNTAQRLQMVMRERGLKQVDILRAAEPFCKEYNVKLGRNDLSQYVAGKVEPGRNKLSILGLALNVSEAWLMGYDVPIGREKRSEIKIASRSTEYIPVFGGSSLKTKKVPLLGNIVCGEPIFANEEHGEYILASGDIDTDFCLRAQGDSMIGARILDGDIVFVKQQPSVENGQIAAVLIGDEATLKRVYYYPDKNKLVLNPENPAFEPLVYVGEELNEVRILGHAIAFQSTVK